MRSREVGSCCSLYNNYLYSYCPGIYLGIRRAGSCVWALVDDPSEAEVRRCRGLIEEGIARQVKVDWRGEVNLR